MALDGATEYEYKAIRDFMRRGLCSDKYHSFLVDINFGAHDRNYRDWLSG